MKVQLIEDEKKVFEYTSEICPTKGDTVKRLCYVLTLWEVEEVRHVVNLIAGKDVEEMVTLIVKEI